MRRRSFVLWQFMARTLALVFVVFVVAAAVSSQAHLALADDARVLSDAGIGDAGSDAQADDPAIAQLRTMAGDVRALLEGRLDPPTAPESLFDIPIADDDAVRLEAARLRLLFNQPDASASHTKTTPARSRPTARELDATAPTVAAVNPALLAARLDLDRARLAFYELGSERACTTAARRRYALRS